MYFSCFQSVVSINFSYWSLSLCLCFIAYLCSVFYSFVLMLDNFYTFNPSIFCHYVLKFLYFHCIFSKPCSDEKQNGFKCLKLKRCKFLEPFFTSCEHDCFRLKTLKYFRFKCFRRFLKIIFSKNSPQVILICYCFFIKIEVMKANENRINISHEKCRYLESCLEARDRRTKWDKQF